MWQGRSVGSDKIIKKLTTINVSFYRVSESKISGDNKCKIAISITFQISFWHS